MNVGDTMKFSDFICFDAVVPQLSRSDRDGVIGELVSSLDKAGKLAKGSSRKITKGVIGREREASTGMGKGVAVPHIKHNAVKDVVATVGLCGAGIDFSALDKQPVFSVILLISPDDCPDKHLQAMEKIFQHIQQEKFRKFLRQCQTAEQIEELFREADEDPAL